ncbi:MAG: Hpt domain-containing protein [Pseudomonadales bacterium]|nr:Hpt domain-containing protein [Pseudomonadales bacterium]
MLLKELPSKPLIIALLTSLSLASIGLSFFASYQAKLAAMESQTGTLTRVVEVASDEIFSKLFSTTSELAELVQKSKTIRKLVKQTKKAPLNPDQKQTLATALSEQFHQRYVTAGVIDLIKVRVYDKKLQHIVSSTDGLENLGSSLPNSIANIASVRQKADRYKALGMLWHSNNIAYYSLLYPVGGLSLAGYVEVVVAPAHNLKIIDTVLGAPLKVESLDNVTLYQSDSWTSIDLSRSSGVSNIPGLSMLSSASQENILEINYFPKLSNGQPAMKLVLQEDITVFRNSIIHTQKMIVGLFVGLGILGLAIALVLLRKNLFAPLKELSDSVSLIAAGNLDTELKQINRKDELGCLLGSVESMRVDLKDMIQNLDDKVAQRTEELVAVQHEVADILNSVKEGIFTFNPDLSINNEHSKMAEVIFHTQQFDTSSLRTLLQLTDDDVALFEDWIGICANNTALLSRWSMYSKLSPIQEIQRDGDLGDEVIQIEYQPITDEDGQLIKMMILASDVTEQRRIQAALDASKLRQENLTERVIAMIGGNSQEIEDWFSGSQSALSQFNTYANQGVMKDQVEKLFRDMHTLKGHSGTLGFMHFAGILGKAENCLDELRKKTTIDFKQWSQHIASAEEELKEISQIKSKIFSSESDEGIWVNKTIYENMLNNLKDSKSYDITQLFTAIGDLNTQYFGSYCQKYTKLVSRLSESMDKPLNDLVIETPDILVNRDLLKSADDAIVHILRNALDHGIESEEAREEQGKESGCIRMSATTINNILEIVISDDGAGIDANKLSAIALEKGLISENESTTFSPEEKLQLIFLPGLTSKDTVSDISGRGVGMDAVTSSIEKLNGTVSLTSQLKIGTTITLRIPIDIVPVDFSSFIIPEHDASQSASNGRISH